MTKRGTSAADRIMAAIEYDTNGGCWLWGRALYDSGYGMASTTHGRHTTAHAAAYRAFVGDVPEGLVLDHLCRVRACCNPAHLEPVTFLENLRRGDNSAKRAARRTHCSQGHEYTLETVAYRGRSRHRRCLLCERDYRRAHRTPHPREPIPAEIKRERHRLWKRAYRASVRSVNSELDSPTPPTTEAGR